MVYRVVHYTIMDFSAGVHYVPEKILTEGLAEVNTASVSIIFFWCISHHVHKLKRS